MWICEKGSHCVDSCDDCEHHVEIEYVVRGHWEDGAFENSKRCSVCGRYATKIHNYNQPGFDYVRCPYCGAHNTLECGG